ncbi:ABC transporter permease [Neobacillus jeddahensis]|uniref:ABC transporter permease n=1 Tax=Neobacillus jeddahensis TaxID=1461580 RepID=UPI000693C255|nr:ABC transporter permease [Neobacillus jeddahensis]
MIEAKLKENNEGVLAQNNQMPVDKKAKSSNPSKVYWKVFKTSPLGISGLVILVLIIFAAIAAPILAPYDPLTQNITQRVQGISAEHWLGTDAYGRDILSRIIFGAQTSLTVGLLSVLASGVIGTAIGIFAGYKGGKFDEILMRIIESIMSIPMLLLGLMLLVALGSNMTTLVTALSIGLVPSCARIARGPALEIKESEYVKAAIASGASSFRIMVVHILPNIMGSLLVVVTLNMASAIRIEASLSFLGIGIQPPTPTWGNMIKDSLSYLTTAPSLAIFPGLALMITVIAFNLIGDTIRDASDPYIIRKRG